MTLTLTKLCGLATAVALLGGTIGYVAEAHAVDRVPFPGRPINDAGPGYGAERQYYGAENIYRPRRGGAYHNYRTYGSFVEFGAGGYPAASLPFGSFAAASRAGVYPSFGGSFVYLGNAGEEAQSSRRDDRSGEQDGVSVSYVGSTKIIRIASGRNAREGQADARRGTGLEPWSEGWERYCTRTHPDFDPARRTFTDGNGRSRFCTGE